MSFGDEFTKAWSETHFDPSILARIFNDARCLFFVGNGGSAAIASHMANDFSKNGGKHALAFNDASALTCLANDFGYEKVFEFPLNQHLRGLDVLIAISSSGESENIILAANVARRKAAALVTFTGFSPHNRLRKLGKQNIYVPSSDYGVVETMHLGMLHAVIREMPNARR